MNVNTLTQPQQEPGSDQSRVSDGSRRRPRARIIVASATAAVLIAGGTGAWFWQQNRAPATAEGSEHTVSETAVEKGSVTVETQAAGTMQFAGQRSLGAGPAGIVTNLLSVGTTVKVGDALYSVNARPVMLLDGAIPAWRDFSLGMSRGEDVRQLEKNLAAFGVFRGDVDTEFTGLTEQAIKSWQKAMGVDQSGIVERTAIMFSPEEIRIAEQKSALGANVGEGTELYVISSTSKSATVQLSINDQKLALLDSPVTIVLPNGVETAGVVSSVGVPTEAPSTDPNAPKGVVLPVTISLSDPAAAAEFTRSSVSVRFTSTLSADALTVPVEALLAINDQSFAVEVQDPDPDKPSTKIPVKTGAFGSGRVEISGDGITEGMKVVVPTR